MCRPEIIIRNQQGSLVKVKCQATPIRLVNSVEERGMTLDFSFGGCSSPSVHLCPNFVANGLKNCFLLPSGSLDHFCVSVSENSVATKERRWSTTKYQLLVAVDFPMQYIHFVFVLIFDSISSSFSEGRTRKDRRGFSSKYT